MPFVVALFAIASPVAAQPDPQTSAPASARKPAEVDDEVEADDIELAAANFDPGTCDQPAPLAASSAAGAAPVTWSDFEVIGTLVDPAATVRALLEPTLNRHRALTNDAREDIRRAAVAFGYHLTALGTRESAAGTIAVVALQPLPIVRHIDVPNPSWSSTRASGDEVRRRMRTRIGAYLPWRPDERACELHREKIRIEEYLFDEGYFEARATIVQKRSGAGITLKVKVRLGPAYETDIERITIPDAETLAVSADKIRDTFRHKGCLLGQYVCVLSEARFTRAQHQADVQRVAELFHKAGYPAVRVRSDFRPEQSIDRRTKTVRFSLTIDQRRRLDVVFEGHSASVSTENLRKQLTFDEAASTDDVEASESARRIAAYLQSRGYFDARVTWTRERFGVFDRLIYRIEQGKTRNVRTIEFVGHPVLEEAELRETIGTKEVRFSRTLFGSSTAATSELLANDVDRLADLYRRKGYRDARIRVSASTDPIALGSAALTAALVSAERGTGLHVRFTIDAGLPTLLTQVIVELDDHGDTIRDAADRALCEQVLKDLAELYKHPPLATPVSTGRCIGIATNLAFREDEAADTKDQIKNRMFERGRPRTEVAYEPVVIGPHRIAAKYHLTDLQALKMGKVVIRGNFRTRNWIIRNRLGLDEGEPLTSDALAEGARRLRNTGLFDSVNITMPDLETTSAGAVNAVIEVTERHDHFAQVTGETGYSSFNGTFVKAIPSIKNLFGVGISLDLSATYGFDLVELPDLRTRQVAAEATLRIPQWLTTWSPIEFQTEVNAFHRRQETARFGLLRTTGATLVLSRTWERQRVGTRAARAITFGLHYDYRSRERNVDALRPIGADDDDSQVPITTITGSAGPTFEWEQRTDRRGVLSPLAPEAGFRFDAQAAFASPYLLGQDTFIKVSAAGSKYWPLTDSLVLRADLRYDQGFPLGGAALLPEVERFFAGGDSTVRGYDDERLATEVIQTGVPPLDNIEQIRILPAGGNIRVIGSVDAQVRIYKILASALFFDAGVIRNQWSAVEFEDIRPSIGMALARLVTPFGVFAFERAIPLRPKLGDDPRGRWHISFAARAQF
ncbi:MAG: BamA/TamA family outer membrane protein [Deltaproteobacteria bacterium]|nr:BamA/TamA family outer membrane protein [Deltaproteobacteria bacterium]MDQ3300638.1 BamA/TamA family outer membrane protein [Myxococcota bacterium]